MALIRSILNFFRTQKPEPKFRPGDQVQLLGGGPIMIVETVDRLVSGQSAFLMLHCKWFDPERNEKRLGTFSEKQVKLFDWYLATNVTVKVQSSSPGHFQP